MRKFILALAFLVAGCAPLLTKFDAVQSVNITQNQVDAARSGYDGAVLAPLRRYALTPRCVAGQTFISNQCHDAATLKKLRSIDIEIAKDFNDVQGAMQSGNVSALQAAWTVLNNNISSAKTTIAQVGLN